MEIGRDCLRAKCAFTALCVLVNVKGLLIVGAGMPRLCNIYSFQRVGLQGGRVFTYKKGELGSRLQKRDKKAGNKTVRDKG